MCPVFQYFKDFIEQEIEKFAERNNPENEEENQRKKIREISKPSVITIDQTYYFVSGSDQVFLLNKDEATPGYAKKLTEDDIENLPEELVYSGQPESFSDDEGRAFQLLVTILFNMNLMQEKEVIHTLHTGAQVEFRLSKTVSK
jgi:hypothetical protein